MTMKKKCPILLVEDDADLLGQLAGALEDEGFQVSQASTKSGAFSALAGGEFHLVITDLNLPDGTGIELLNRVRKNWPDMPVLVITAYASVDTAVEAMKAGAFHYLSKPVSLEPLLIHVDKALEHGAVLMERRALREHLSTERGLGRIVGRSRLTREMTNLIRDVAGTDSTVLITGETGTGKELVASALHFESHRAHRPMLSVNCAALTESLLESELFGHEKGAFTGADKQRQGRFEAADGGTLFLDEITEMGEHIQAKLLRVLQGSGFERVGGSQPLEVDVRIVAATNRDPKEAVEEGRLREDLYYRLNVILIEVPPLRKRVEDIPPLAQHFLDLYMAKHKKTFSGIAPEAVDALCSHDWPGNIRELENAVERAVILGKGDSLELGNLPPPLSGRTPRAGESSAGSLNLTEVERNTILTALDDADWNKSRAAELLGVFPSSLYKKMKRLDIPIQRPE